MKEIIFNDARGAAIYPVIGAEDWYTMMEVQGDKFSHLDIYDAGILFRREGHCPGMNHILISPDKQIHRPFSAESSKCVGKPIYHQGLFYFFRIDFVTEMCEIWTYEVSVKQRQKIDEFTVNPIEDTYNLGWIGSPIILTSDGEELQILWPEKRKYVGLVGQFIERNNQFLYFYDFFEPVDNMYYENINVYDMETGKLIKVYENYTLQRVGDEIWIL